MAVGTVLNYLNTLYLISDLSRKVLILKLTTLVCLVKGQRYQTITNPDSEFLQKTQERSILTILKRLKTSKPGRHLDPIELGRYKPDLSLCVVEHLTEYLGLTSGLRQQSKLLISFTKPHNATSSTIGRWEESVLKDAGIDMSEFCGNSGRSASTSKSKLSGLPP